MKTLRILLTLLLAFVVGAIAVAQAKPAPAVITWMKSGSASGIEARKKLVKYIAGMSGGDREALVKK